MPLLEESTNMQRQGQNARIHRKIPSTSTSSITSVVVPPPVAVQSMLRTRMEVGNVNHLPRRPPHSTITGTRLQSTRRRSGSFDSSLASALHHRRSPRYRPERYHNNPLRLPTNPRHSYRDSFRSNSISKLSTARARPLNSRTPLQPLHSHRSNMTLRTYAKTRNKDSRSPSVFSTSTNSYYDRAPPLGTRGRFSDNERLHVQQYGQRISTTSSPASIAVRRGFANTARINVPTRASRALPSPMLMTQHYPARTILPPSRATSRSSTQRSFVQPDHGLPATNIAPKTSACRSATPRYYDYSESFVEEECFSPDVRSASFIHPNSLDQTMMNSESVDMEGQAEPLSGRETGSTPLPVELSTTFNQITDKTTNMRFDPPSSIHVAELPAEGIERSNSLMNGPFELDTNTRCLNGSLQPLPPPVSFNFHSFKIKKSEHDLALSGAHLHSPARSVDMVDTTVAKRSKQAGLDDKSVATFNNAFKASLNKFQEQNLTATEKPGTSSLCMERKPLEIISPTPERPMSSQSRRRFRKIIELGSSEEASELQHTSVRNPTETNSESADDFPPSTLTKHVHGTEQISPRPSSLLKANVLEDPTTPQEGLHVSVVTSNGKSTVESLLDNHIQSLGLMPERDSFSDSADTSVVELLPQHNDPGYRSMSETSFLLTALYNDRPLTSTGYRASSPSSSTRVRLKPRKLFASMDGRITSWPELKKTASDHRLYEMLGHSGSPSYAWLTLASTSQTVSHVTSTKPTLTSGEMADIDSDLYPLGRRFWQQSQLSLPTSFEDSVTATVSQGGQFCAPKRSRSELLARQASRHRRRVQVLLRHKSLSDIIKNHRSGRTEPDHHKLHQPVVLGCVKLHDELSHTSGIGLCANSRSANVACVPKRWSDIVAAMPLPGTGNPGVPRKVSIRSAFSQRSLNSQISVIDPLNSTRQRKQIPHLSNAIPKLAPPDFGPRLDASTLHLSIPYAEAPSTIYPSIKETKSFFDDSPSRGLVLSRSVKRRFGLRPLRTVAYGSRGASLTVTDEMPKRNGIPIPAIGPSRTDSVTIQQAHQYPISLSKTEPLSDFTYRKRKVVEKFKLWWKRQCVQKSFRVKRGRNVQPELAGILV